MIDVPMTLAKFRETYGWPETFLQELRDNFGLRIVGTAKTKGIYPAEFVLAFQRYENETEGRRELRTVSAEQVPLQSHLPGRSAKARPTGADQAGSEGEVAPKIRKRKSPSKEQSNVRYSKPVVIPGGRHDAGNGATAHGD